MTIYVYEKVTQESSPTIGELLVKQCTVEMSEHFSMVIISPAGAHPFIRLRLCPLACLSVHSVYVTQ